MANDCALFIIQLPNDFIDENSFTPKPSNGVKSLILAPLINPLPVKTSSTDLPSISSIIEKRHERAKKSLCTLLTDYLAKMDNIEAVWMTTDDKKTYQVTFYAEFGVISDRIVHDLMKLGIGRSNNTKVFVLPTTLILEGEEEQTLSVKNNNNNNIETNDINLTSKIRKHFSESSFKRSIRARLMVHQVVASIRAATTLSFDFVLLICLASMLAACGLLENSTVILVASMLVSPLMNPILGIVFGLSVRDHSLWKQGLRNEFIGLIICTICGFIIGLLTTFTETKWGSSTSFPTAEMKSRGDVKRLWVGVLIALPSGAGVALSVLGGNTGSLVGVAISASLLPPAVNCGLLFAYSLLGVIFPNVAATSSLPSNQSQLQYSTSLNCTYKYINNDYEPFYTCHLEREAAILGSCSLLLTIVNILCIIIMGLFILRIKEVVPLHQTNKDIANFFHYDVKVARDYNKTVHENDIESTSMFHRNRLAQSLVKRWRTTNNDIELAHDENHSNAFSVDTESRRKLLCLKTFATEYNLDVFDKHDYNLLTVDSQEKVGALVNDLLDVCQEQDSTVLAELSHLQPSGSSQASANREKYSFYQEIIKLLPPKWYELFIRAQEQRQMTSWPTTSNQLRLLTNEQFTTKINEKHYALSQRRRSAPLVTFHPSIVDQENRISIENEMSSKQTDNLITDQRF